ncbi:MAG TPA: DEAD/DEAH box helicase [Polyangiaceae bacterium]|nr:DEAD/DEAH box helicase [Polyangiaceae bacterium]
MTVATAEITDPTPTFDVLPLSPEVRRAVDELGYVVPTPVQVAVYEPATRGRDLVVQARTGTGKTAAFGLPLADALVRRGTEGVQALVLCPTRELALQVTQELEALTRHRGLSTVAVYGGAPMQRQIDQLRAGAQILVGTPGRVLDHLRHRTLTPSHVRVLILDESDEMLSMGFLPQINEILAFLPPVRQTLLFSATLPPGVKRMAENRLRNPEFITLSGDQIGALEVRHLVYYAHGDKTTEFLSMLEVEDPESAIVFCNTRDQTRRVAAALQQRGYSADWLNADLAQSDREKVMEATRRGAVRFLVATDVAARGIDISHLTHVINYDFPDSAEAYVHRTGRTGRAGRTGTAISMVAPSDVGNLYLVRLTFGIRPDARHVPSARELRTRAEVDLVGTLVRTFADRPVRPEDVALARRVLTDDRGVVILAGLLRDHLGDGPEAADDATRARRSTPPRPATRTPTGPRTGPEPRPAAEPRGGAARSAAPTAAEPELRGEDEDAPPELRENGPERTRAQRPRRRRRDHGRGEPDVARAGSPRSEDPAMPDDDLPRYTVESVAEGPAPSPAEIVEIYVNVGRRDGAEDVDFLSVLDAAGLDTAVDSVNVRLRHTFVRVRRTHLDQAIAALDGAEIRGRRADAEAARHSGFERKD